jgi:hypothetical protein
MRERRDADHVHDVPGLEPVDFSAGFFRNAGAIERSVERLAFLYGEAGGERRA